MGEQKAERFYQYLSTSVGIIIRWLLIKSKQIPKKYVVLACIGALQIGFLLGWSSPAVPMLEHGKPNKVPLRANYEQTSQIVAIAPLGAVFGALIAGSIANRFGRKKTIMLTAIPTFCAWLSIIVLPSIIILYIARFVLGIIMGILAAVLPMYIGEIAEISIRGALGTMFQVFLLSGEITLFALGLADNYYVLAVPGVISAVVLQIGTFMIPESPCYYMEKGAEAPLKEAMKTLRGANYDITSEIEQLRADAKILTEKIPFLTMMQSKANVKAILIAASLMAFQQFSGINTIVFFSNSIFEMATPSLSPALVTVGVSLWALVATIFAAFIVDKTGRKIVLNISALGMAGSFWILATYFSLIDDNIKLTPWIPVMCVLVYLVSFSIGWASVPWVMAGELFSMEIKRIGNGIASAVNFISTFAVSYVFREMSLRVGNDIAFKMFACICLISVLFTVFIVPETNKKTFKQIQDELAGITSSSSSP